MTECVVDASIVAHALIGRDARANELRDRLRQSVCHAPHLIDAELGNVLRKRLRAGDVTSKVARVALDVAAEAIDFRYPHHGALASVAWSFRDNLSFYDALYVALATRLDIPLLTGDIRLSKAPGLRCQVEVG